MPSRVARTEKLTLFFIPDGEGEHAVQFFDGFGAFQHEQAQDDLSVGIGEELAALTGQLLAQLHVVVDLSVVNDPVAPGLVAHGLVPGRAEVNDAQAQVGDAQVVVDIITAVVGTAVLDAVCHVHEGRFTDPVLAIKVVNPAYSAHLVFP
jgi:hypothetical protein